MFTDELKKQFTANEVKKIQKLLLEALIGYDKEKGTYPESTWEGAGMYQFLTGDNVRKHAPNEASYYLPYWQVDKIMKEKKGEK